MRVSDRSTARNYLRYINDAKSAYSKTTTQLASGNRFERISDDVSAGTKVMRSRMDMYKTEKHLANVKSVNEEMKATEDSLMAVNEILSSAHSGALKAASQADVSSTNDILANEMKNLKEQMLQMLNSKFGQKYSFGGSNANMYKEPFSVDTNGKLLYNGVDVDIIEKDSNGFFYMDNGDRKDIPMDEDVYMDVGLGIRMNGSQIDGQTGFKISYSGLEAFGFGTDPDTGLSNNVYNILSDLEKNIRTFDKEKITAADKQLQSLTEKFRVNIADIGSKTKFLQGMQDRLESNVTNYKTKINDLMGVNETEAAISQGMNEAVLKSVLQMGSYIIPVSLMDFIR